MKLSTAILYCIVAFLPGTCAIPVAYQQGSSTNVTLTARAPQTMYHATFINNAQEIINEMKTTGKLELKKNRQWPNEFSWTGSCFLTVNSRTWY
jgi:hypothetical protein